MPLTFNSIVGLWKYILPGINYKPVVGKKLLKLFPPWCWLGGPRPMPNGDEDVVGTPGLEDHPLSHVEENTIEYL